MIPTGIPKIKKRLTIPNVGKDTTLEEYKIQQPRWKTIWQFLIKVNMYLLDDPTILI